MDLIAIELPTTRVAVGELREPEKLLNVGLGIVGLVDRFRVGDFFIHIQIVLVNRASVVGRLQEGTSPERGFCPLCPVNRRPEGKAVRPVSGSVEKPVRAGRR